MSGSAARPGFALGGIGDERGDSGITAYRRRIATAASRKLLDSASSRNLSRSMMRNLLAVLMETGNKPRYDWRSDDLRAALARAAVRKL
jgi:hypothetical protein